MELKDTEPDCICAGQWGPAVLRGTWCRVPAGVHSGRVGGRVALRSSRRPPHRRIPGRDLRRRGNGRSPRPPGWHATSIAEQADDVAGLIEALGLAPLRCGRAAWAGSSCSNSCSAARRGRHGDRAEPPLFGVLEDGEQFAAGLLPSAARAVRANAVPMRSGPRPPVRRGGVRPPTERRPGADVRQCGGLLRSRDPGASRDPPHSVSAARALRRIDIPLCVMADANNAGAPPVRAARWLAEVIGAEFRSLPGGHMPYATKPETTAAAIRAAINDPGGTTK